MLLSIKNTQRSTNCIKSVIARGCRSGMLLCVPLASGFVERGGAVGIASSSSTALPFLPLLSLEADSLFAVQVLSYNLLFEYLSTKYSLNRLG